MTEAVKHTPGPWSYQMSDEDCCDYEVYVGSGLHSIDIIAGEYGIESEADARLMSAAPDLLEALKAVTDDKKSFTLALDLALKAIAKAEGN